MTNASRRAFIASSGSLLVGGFAGCAGFTGGSDLPDRIPLLARNERAEHVALAYWCSTSASVPDTLSIDGVAQLNGGEETRLTEIPVEAPDGSARPDTRRTPVGEGESRNSPTPVRPGPGGYVAITADLQQRSDQRNVVLHVDTGSDVLSEMGYLITVRSEPVRDVGTPDQPVSHDAVPGNESVAGDFIEIGPRSTATVTD